MLGLQGIVVKCTAAIFVFPTVFSLFLGRIVRGRQIVQPYCFLLILAHEESLHTRDWQLESTDSTDDDKTRGPPQLDPVLIYTPTGSMETPSSTPAGSTDSEVFEGRDRLLSRSPRKGPNVFTVNFKT